MMMDYGCEGPLAVGTIMGVGASSELFKTFESYTSSRDGIRLRRNTCAKV